VTTPAAPPEWLEVALDLPCRLYLADTGARCGATPTREYLRDRRCWEHAPVAYTPATTTRKDGPRG
jgi:hypothetical protein